MKRHGGDFEKQTGRERDHSQQQHRPKRRQSTGGICAAAERNNLADAAPNLAEIGRAGNSIKQRHAVEQDAGRERAEQKIFHRRFVRTLFAFRKSDQHIKRQRHQLETDVERNQIVATAQKHHADSGKQHERVVFAVLFAFNVEIPRGDGDGEAPRRSERLL